LINISNLHYSVTREQLQVILLVLFFRKYVRDLGKLKVVEYNGIKWVDRMYKYFYNLVKSYCWIFQ